MLQPFIKFAKFKEFIESNESCLHLGKSLFLTISFFFLVLEVKGNDWNRRLPTQPWVQVMILKIERNWNHVKTTVISNYNRYPVDPQETTN